MPRAWLRVIGIGLLGLLAPVAHSAQLDYRVQRTDGRPLANAVVAAVPAQTPSLAPPPRAEMDQRNFHFVPEVLAIRTNTLVYFPNSDDVRHHVYSFSPAKKFELRLYHGKTAEPVLFDQPGKVVLGCNIHDSMVATIYVLDTPYYALSDEDGLAQLKDLPAGDYRIEIYHPQREQPYLAPAQRLAANQQLQLQAEVDALVEPPPPSDEFSNLFN